MSMKLLRRLAQADLPIQVRDFGEIQNLRTLKMAGYLFATIPLPRYEREDGWVQDLATVHEITALGHMVLRQLAPVGATRRLEIVHDHSISA